MNKLLASSANPEKLSLTIKGILIGLPAVLIAVFQALNVPIASSDVVEFFQNINALIGIVVTILGGLRKGWFAIKEWLGL